MDEFSHHIVLEAQAALVRVEAMKAANAAAQMNRQQLQPYGENDFRVEANIVEQCSFSLRARAG